jgi:hypothetical protein
MLRIRKATSWDEWLTGPQKEKMAEMDEAEGSSTTETTEACLSALCTPRLPS